MAQDGDFLAFFEQKGNRGKQGRRVTDLEFLHLEGLLSDIAGEGEREIDLAVFFPGGLHHVEVGEPRPVALRGFGGGGADDVLGDEDLFLLDVSLLSLVVLLILLFVELVLEHIGIEIHFVTGHRLILQDEDHVGDLAQESLVVGDHQERLWVILEIGRKPGDLGLVEEVRWLVHDEDVFLFEQHLG